MSEEAAPEFVVIILADQHLLELPLEALELFRSDNVDSISRDISLQMFYHRYHVDDTGWQDRRCFLLAIVLFVKLVYALLYMFVYNYNIDKIFAYGLYIFWYSIIVVLFYSFFPSSLSLLCLCLCLLICDFIVCLFQFVSISICEQNNESLMHWFLHIRCRC